MIALLALAATATACTSPAAPYSGSREVLGTAVTITLYAGDAVSAKASADAAFDRMSAVEKVLSPYDPTSPISAVNADPFEEHALPVEGAMVFTALDAWGIGPARTDVTRAPTGRDGSTASAGDFSPTLWGVTRLYGFGATETVPAGSTLAQAVAASRAWVLDGNRFRFLPPSAHDPGRTPPQPGMQRMRPADATPGLDLGGAAKGLAIDFALQQLGDADAGLITAGSSTLAFGSKPDGSPWRVGIEDPRDTGRVIAVVTAEARGDGTRTLPPVPALSVSTSGDYQQFFERDGVRYHHILDPSTGEPARGLRSLTVFGRMNGLDADVLSTALFVMGRDRALAYARKRGVGVYLVDSAGRPGSYVPASMKGISLEVRAEPRP